MEKLYRHDLDDGTEVLLKRITVASRAELITAFCTRCAEDKQTGQVLCYQRTLAKGEVIGLERRTAKTAPSKSSAMAGKQALRPPHAPACGAQCAHVEKQDQDKEIHAGVPPL